MVSGPVGLGLPSAGWIVLVIALLVRLWVLLDLSGTPAFDIPLIDATIYHHAGLRLAAGEGLDKQFFFQPLLYPCWLGAVYRLTGDSILAVRLLQALLGGATCWLVWLLGVRIWDRRTGLLGGLLVALCGPLLYFESQLLATGWAAFWSVAMVLVLWEAARKPRVWRLALLGLMGAAAILTRPTFLPLLVAGCGWLALRWWKSRPPITVMIGRITLILLVIAGPLLLASELNRMTTGHFGFLPASGGINLYIGNNAQREAATSARVGPEWSDLLELPVRDGLKGDMWARQDWYLARTWEYITDNPGSYLGGLVNKTIQLMSGREIPRNIDPYMLRQDSVLLRGLMWKMGGFGFPMGLLLPLAVVGLFRLRGRESWLLTMSLVILAMSVILVFVTARYRVPLIPLLAIAAAAGVWELVDLTRNRRWRPLLPAGTGLIGLILLGCLPGPFPPERIDYAPELQGCLANAHHSAGRLLQAEDAFHEALELDPQYVGAMLGLAELHVERQEWQSALDYFQAALQVDPGLDRVHARLCGLLTELRLYEQAEPHCRKAISSRPFDENVQLAQARYAAELGDFTRAEQHLREAVVINPSLWRAHRELGRLLLLRGTLTEAVEHFRRSLEGEPDQTDALTSLAWLLAVHPEPAQRDGDEAVDLAQRALAISGESARMLDILGAALAEAGHYAQAVETLTRALQLLDPQASDGQISAIQDRLELYRQSRAFHMPVRR